VIKFHGVEFPLGAKKVSDFGAFWILDANPHVYTYMHGHMYKHIYVYLLQQIMEAGGKLETHLGQWMV
jgi:hypothetical protein